MEKTLNEFIKKLLAITQELRRILKPSGVFFLNHGDCYGGSGGPGGDYDEGGLREGQPKPPKREWKDPKLPARKRAREQVFTTTPKCLALQNYRLLLKMIDDQGWILRNIIQWFKPNHMPSSVKDRFANSYEPVFMLVKQSKPQYYYNVKTGLMADRKPKVLKEGIDWDWKEIEEYISESGANIGGHNKEPYKGNNPHLLRLDKKKTEKRKKVSYWHSLNYWFDLDAVRQPHSSSSIERNKYQWTSKQRTYSPTEKRGIDYRDKPIGGQTKIPPDQAESFGSPRARYHRDKTQKEDYKASGMRNAPEPGEPNAFNPAGKNPGDVISVPTENYYVETNGKLYKVSLDCPIHSHLYAQGNHRKDAYGGQQVLKKNHNPDISKNPSLKFSGVSSSMPPPIQHSDPGPKTSEHISQSNPGHKTSASHKDRTQNHPHNEGKERTDACNSDFSGPVDVGIATFHNKRKSKNISPKVLDDNASDKTSCHKSGKKQSSQVSDLDSPYSNYTTEKCSCQEVIVEHFADKPDVWSIPPQPYKMAHFATFPEKLIEPMIKSSCPEWICKKCGKARVRIISNQSKAGFTEKEYKEWEKKTGIVGQDRGNRARLGLKMKGTVKYERKTIGWTDCGCGAGFRPGVVLDPFMGAGTTTVVAKKLGRSWLGIELSPEYIKIAEKRISNTMGCLL